MKKLMTIAVAALTCAAFSQEPEAPKDGPHQGRGPMPERGMMFRGGMQEGMQDPAVRAVLNPRIAEKIGLSEDVRLQAQKIDIDAQLAIRELQAKTRAAMDKQAELMKAPKPDEAAVMAAIDELFDLRKEMAKIQTRRVLAVKALLTPEQLEQALAEMKSVREGRRGDREAARDGDRGPRGPREGKGPRRDRRGEGKDRPAADEAPVAPAPAE